MKIELELKTEKPGPELNDCACWVALEIRNGLDWHLAFWNEVDNCWNDDDNDDYFRDPDQVYCWMPLPTPTKTEMEKEK